MPLPIITKTTASFCCCFRRLLRPHCANCRRRAGDAVLLRGFRREPEGRLEARTRSQSRFSPSTRGAAAYLRSHVDPPLFGDGAAAVIIGADPLPEVERPLFELVSATQTLVPDTEGAIVGHLREVGLIFNITNEVPQFISNNIEKTLQDAFEPLGISDWNSLFWIVHQGGPEILRQVEARLALKPEKLETTRHILAEYGNMSSPGVLFIMDEMRKRSAQKELKTTGEGLEWGVLLGFGPGLTIETVLLHSVCA